MSTETIYAAVLRIAQEHARTAPVQCHLDVGSGRGQLIERFRQRFQTESTACDYTNTLMKLPGQKVDVVNLNEQPLPYANASFDMLTATEVIEHLEHYRETLREFHRVLRPGGLCILTTPNVLSLNSRLRYLWFGFPNLFGPLPVKNSTLYSTGGHINPVTFFQVAHALLDAGFVHPAMTADKYQRSALAKLAFWWLPIKFFGALYRRKEVVKYRTIDRHNAPLVDAMNSTVMLLSRSVVVSAVKPPGDAR